MSSRKHGRSKTKESRGVPTQWSEWEWNATYQCYARYRLDADGQYEYDYDNSNSTSTTSQPSTSYPSSTVVAQQTSVEDLNTQYQGLDLGTGRERGREKSRGDQPRDPSVSPSRPVKPGPDPPPFPIPKSSSSAYDSSAGYYQTPPISPTSAASSPYSNVPTGQYDSARGAGYERSHETTSLQRYRPEEVQVTIRKKPFTATISSSNDSFISSETVDYLKLKVDKIKQPWKYRHPGSGKEFDIRESVRINIEPMGGAKLKDVQLYVLSRRCPLKNPIVLGTDILGTTEYAALDYLSDSGYGTAGSRRPSFNQPAAAYHSATHTVDQLSYSSSSPPYHQPIYPQTISSIREVPTSSYSTSSYPTEAERTLSHGTSQSYYPAYDTSAKTTKGRGQDSGFSTFDSSGHPSTVGASGSGERGMEDNLPADGDNYTLHSNSYTSASPYIPRPTSSGDESQNVYSSASDDTVYAEYVKR